MSILSAPSLSARLSLIVSRGLANTELEALCFLRALRAIDRGGSPLEAVARPAYRKLSQAQRVQIARNASAWRSR